MWRSERWVNPCPEVDGQGNESVLHGYFERGADAILEALKRDTMTIPISGGELHEGYIQPRPYTVNLIEKGWLVFIPDEQE